MVRKPYLAGGAMLVAGYILAWIGGEPRPVPPELVRFHRREQMRRLFGKFTGMIGIAPDDIHPPKDKSYGL
jgi:hypothetical protein